MSWCTLLCLFFQPVPLFPCFYWLIHFSSIWILNLKFELNWIEFWHLWSLIQIKDQRCQKKILEKKNMWLQRNDPKIKALFANALHPLMARKFVVAMPAWIGPCQLSAVTGAIRTVHDQTNTSLRRARLTFRSSITKDIALDCMQWRKSPKGNSLWKMLVRWSAGLNTKSASKKRWGKVLWTFISQLCKMENT